MNETEEVTIQRPNVSTLLSSAFIRGGGEGALVHPHKNDTSSQKATFNKQFVEEKKIRVSAK